MCLNEVRVLIFFFNFSENPPDSTRRRGVNIAADIPGDLLQEQQEVQEERQEDASAGAELDGLTNTTESNASSTVTASGTSFEDGARLEATSRRPIPGSSQDDH